MKKHDHKCWQYYTLVLVLFTVLYVRCDVPRKERPYANPQVLLVTELGDIIVEIYVRRAPVTARNFLRYVDDNRYEHGHFYRVVTLDNQPGNEIKIEVIQGGIGFIDSKLRLPAIEHETTQESGIRHQDGVISMARAEPGTADSEIFICIGDQPELDYEGKRNPDGRGFAAFGRVIVGMETVRKIQTQPAIDQILTAPVRILETRRVNIRAYDDSQEVY
ncbi:MAG: peptidylprolyl isomerase [candidate division WOR-3 bacterium]|nr:MAG: peptidylprolyl isomerase [candidate division WOR-3 bacterium]